MEFASFHPAFPRLYQSQGETRRGAGIGNRAIASQSLGSSRRAAQAATGLRSPPAWANTDALCSNWALGPEAARASVLAHAGGLRSPVAA
jgi:hypothetical protein